MDNTFAEGQTVTWAYDDQGTCVLQQTEAPNTEADNQTYTVDNTLMIMVSLRGAYTSDDGTTIILSFEGDVHNTFGADEITAKVNDANAPYSAINIVSASMVELVMVTPIQSGDVISVSYSAPPGANNVEPFTDAFVTNKVGRNAGRG